MPAPPPSERAVAAPRVSPSLVRSLVAVERGTVALLVLALVGFGVWTLGYQVALATGLGSTPTLVVVALVSAGAWYAVLPAFVHTAPDRATAPFTVRLLVPALVVALLVLVLGGLGHRGWMIAVVVVASLAWVGRSLARRRPGTVAGRAVPDRSGARDTLAAGPLQAGLWLTTWFWALACAGLASVTARPDGDDAYFVNLAQWVSARGDFPTRDTMLGDESFPALSSHRPPVHSIEGLIGAIGHLTGLDGGALTYLVAAPALTVLAVLTLGWLVSLSRIRHAPLALSAGVVFLLASGGSGATYGNFFALRMWQGKATLATLVIPLVTAVAIAYVGRGGWRRWLVLALGVVCTIGASNTAVFLVPVLIAGVAVGALVHAGPRRAIGAAATLAYPILCGVVVMALAPTSSGGGGGEEGASTTPMDPLVAVPGRHGLFVVIALALVLGWLGLRSGAARATAVGVVLSAGVALLPPVSDLLVSFAGVGSVIWRMWWVVPVPLLAAALVGAAPEVVRTLAPTMARRPVQAAAALVCAVAVALVPLVGGRWIFSTANGVRLVSPIAWKVPEDAEAEARVAVEISRKGDVVLAPWDVSRVLSGMSVGVHPVSARAIYLPAYRADPGAHVPERTELQKFVDSRTPDPESLRPLVDVLSVDTACVSTKRGKAVRALEQIGFHVAAQKGRLTCLRR